SPRGELPGLDQACPDAGILRDLPAACLTPLHVDAASAPPQRGGPLAAGVAVVECDTEHGGRGVLRRRGGWPVGRVVDPALAVQRRRAVRAGLVGGLAGPSARRSPQQARPRRG